MIVALKLLLFNQRHWQMTNKNLIHDKIFIKSWFCFFIAIKAFICLKLQHNFFTYNLVIWSKNINIKGTKPIKAFKKYFSKIFHTHKSFWNCHSIFSSKFILPLTIFSPSLFIETIIKIICDVSTWNIVTIGKLNTLTKTKWRNLLSKLNEVLKLHITN